MDPVTKAIITAALIATQYAIAASQKFEGPRLQELTVTGGDYGTNIPKLWGTRRTEGTIFYAEELKEVKRRRKTKGGKFNDYTYYGTWAVAVADNEIEDITRIWFDKHLVYDTTGSGPMFPFSFVESALQNKMISDNIRIYKGTRDQLPDPRMEATVNAEFGADSCPAYRGLAYVFLEELPLEKFGNRMPLVTVEAITAGDEQFPWEASPTTDGGFPRPWNGHMSPDGSTFLHVDYQGDWWMWDLVNRTVIARGTIPAQITQDRGIATDGTGEFWAVGFGGSPEWQNKLLRFFGAGYQGVQTVIDGDDIVGGVNSSHTKNLGGGLIGVAGQIYEERAQIYMQGGTDFIVSEPIDFVPVDYFTKGDGVVWAIGHPTETGGYVDGIYVRRVLPFNEFESPTLIPFPYGEPARMYGDLEAGVIWVEEFQHFVGYVRGLVDAGLSELPDFLFIFNDDIDGLASYRYIDNLPVYLMPMYFHWYNGGPTMWIHQSYAQDIPNEINLEDLSTIRTIDPYDWTPVEESVFMYVPALNALASSNEAGGGVVRFRYLDRVSGGPTTLRQICEDIADAVDARDDSDFTAFTQEIKGFSTSQGAAKSIIEPLLALHDADIRPHNFGLQGVLRGSAPIKTVPTARLVVEGTRYEANRQSETDLPQRIDVTFADPDIDQQPNTATATRRQADSQRTTNVNADNYVEDVTTMRQLVERYMRRRWYEQEDYKFSLPRAYIGFEPADVFTQTLDDLSRTVRIEKMEIAANGVLTFTAVRDAPSIALLSGSDGAAADGQVPDTIYSPSTSEMMLADIPLIADNDDTTVPFVYLGLSPMGFGGWPGADVWTAEDNISDDYVFGWASASSDQKATVGFPNGVLPPAVPEVMDNGTSINISLFYGTLTSTTKEDLLNDAMLNLAVIGTEIFQFQTATLETDGTYTLSGLLRGRRGTESSVSTHQAGEYFMLFDSSTLRRSMGVGEIGDTDYYKPVTSGRSVSSVFAKTLTFSGASNKPYSPVHVEMVKDTGTGDWDISWIRRTRIGGNNINGSDVPLGEGSEAYEIEILDVYGDVVRIITSPTQDCVYTDAQQVVDFGVTQPSLSVIVYQMSSVVGRGFPTQAAA